jgi:hypothetical protein
MPISFPYATANNAASGPSPVATPAAEYKASILSAQSLLHYRVAMKSGRVNVSRPRN